MVSTRGIKLKFSENERVLCYEPDPTKAKVLYDSKVLDLVVAKDQKGKKSVEYLIHFQGWNSSWDRYVSEEYVLKDTPENRQLQKDLAEKSQLQLGAYLYRKDRRKHSRKTSERTQGSSDDGSSGSPTRMDTDDGQGVTSSSDESSLDEDLVPLELTAELREFLELDYNLINLKDKLVKLPAEPSIAGILENYWRQYATNQICDSEKNVRQRHPFSNHTKRKPEDIQRNLNLCGEVLDGIRTYFDFTINELLLYNPERGQIETAPAHYSFPLDEKLDESKLKTDSYLDYLRACNNSLNEEDSNQNDDKSLTRRRTLRSSKGLEGQVNGNAQEVKARPSSSNSDGSAMKGWRLYPDSVCTQQPPPPCLVYGAIHLARLFVKLPELLGSSSIEENKLKVVLHHLDSFVEFLSERREWFGDKFYIDK